MNNPYTMDVDQAAAGVSECAPKVAYAFHYEGSDIDQFEILVNESGKASSVVKRPRHG